MHPMSTKYTEEHVWARVENADPAIVTVGITTHAQETLGDIVFVELPAVGKTLQAKEVAGVVESVKTAADVFMPVSGEVTEVNEELRADPSLANADPLGTGWFFKVRLSNPVELVALMDEATYLPFAENA
jgi:glycine cleavage system H protein